jgi:hypothetical protein
VNSDQLADAILEKFRAEIAPSLKHGGFEIGPRVACEYAAFATDKPNILALDFKVSFASRGLAGESSGEAILTFEGQAKLDTDIPKFFEVNFSSDTLTYEFSDGSDQQHVTVYLKTAPPLLLQGGPSPWGKVKHSVKYEIGKLQE